VSRGKFACKDRAHRQENIRRPWNFWQRGNTGEALITAIAPMDHGPQWFERLHAREPNLMKVVLTPGVFS